MSEINQEFRDKKYNEWARRNPAIVSIVFPLIVVIYFYQKNTEELSSIRYLVGVVLSFGSIVPALFFFFQSAVREISVLLVESPLFLIFGRPAVNLIKKKNNILSSQRKRRIIAKARQEGITIPTIIGNNICAKRKIAREAFERIRERCRENPVLFEFNCTYGFFRNLSGGVIVDLFICACLKVYNKMYNLGADSLICISFFVLIVLLLFCIICTYYSAIRYAKRVYVAYDNE